jgi:hypothetical protein
MNEKIKQLAEQATRNVESANSYHSTVFDKEKFAELIVAECCNVARHTILLGSGVDPNTFAGTVTTVQEIKKHFGVEE